LAIYSPMAPALAWPWGPYGVLVAQIVSNAASTVYGIRVTSIKYDALPDLKASGRTVITALVAAVPAVTLVQFHLTGVGVSNLVAGALVYLLVYLTLAPVFGAVDKFDVTNLRTILTIVPLSYRGIEVRFTPFTELGQIQVDQNILEVVTLDGNVIDLNLIRSQVIAEKKESKLAARASNVMTRMVAIFTDSVLDYEERLLHALGRD
jgi:hypothetical protein